MLAYACVYSFYNQDTEQMDVVEQQTEHLELHTTALQILLGGPPRLLSPLPRPLPSKHPIPGSRGPRAPLPQPPHCPCPLPLPDSSRPHLRYRLSVPEDTGLHLTFDLID